MDIMVKGDVKYLKRIINEKANLLDLIDKAIKESDKKVVYIVPTAKDNMIVYKLPKDIDGLGFYYKMNKGKTSYFENKDGKWKEYKK